jgi:hypothetical protein
MSWFKMAPKSAVPQKRCLDQVEHLFCLGTVSHRTVHGRLRFFAVSTAEKKLQKKRQAGQKNTRFQSPKQLGKGKKVRVFGKVLYVNITLHSSFHNQ